MGEFVEMKVTREQLAYSMAPRFLGCRKYGTEEIQAINPIFYKNEYLQIMIACYFVLHYFALWGIFIQLKITHY